MLRQIVVSTSLTTTRPRYVAEADIVERTRACGIFQNSIDQTIESGNQQA